MSAEDREFADTQHEPECPSYLFHTISCDEAHPTASIYCAPDGRHLVRFECVCERLRAMGDVHRHPQPQHVEAATNRETRP